MGGCCRCREANGKILPSTVWTTPCGKGNRMPRPRRLLTFGHSYTVTLNRCLAKEMSRAGRGAWEVTAAAPVYFRGYNDLRPTRLSSTPQELCPPVPLPAYLTRLIHVFYYGR